MTTSSLLDSARSDKLTTSHILSTWWPLAASWLIMTAEIPLLAAVAARKADPAINLAAWGVVFPLALILASPVTMLLAASTTLSKDEASYRKLRKYMLALAGVLTTIHALLAFTPLFYRLVEDVIGVPPQVVEPARLGFQIMLPWAAALAYRRFNYGVLIRFEHTRAVTLGAIIRLVCDVVAMLVLFYAFDLPGIAVAAGTIVVGVISEAIYAKIRVRPVLRDELSIAQRVAQPLTLRSFSSFYIPLVMTSLLAILVQPIGSAALSRMPDPLASLAVWPVVYGVLIVMMSAGLAFTEVTVVLLDQPGSVQPLQRFAVKLALTVVGLLLIMNITPLAQIWFGSVVGLPPELIPAARAGLWIGLLAPGLTVLESWFSGVLLHSRKTRGITEAMILGLTVLTSVLALGIASHAMNGVNVVALAMVCGALARVSWLWLRTRPARRVISAGEPQFAN